MLVIAHSALYSWSLLVMTTNTAAFIADSINKMTLLGYIVFEVLYIALKHNGPRSKNTGRIFCVYFWCTFSDISDFLIFQMFVGMKEMYMVGASYHA